MKDNGGLPRKTLASQLDRLDEILNGLSENLNDAVAQAAKDAVGLAIQGVLTEVLTNPELQARLRPEPAAPAAPPPPAVKGPGWLGRLAGVAKGACSTIINQARQAGGKAAQTARGMWQSASACLKKVPMRVSTLAKSFWALLCGAAGVAWQARKPLVLALGAGAALGLGCYLADSAVSAIGVLGAPPCGLTRTINSR